MKISFNKPYLTGKETHYIYEAVYKNSHISGNGNFTKNCQTFFNNRFGFKKSLLTTSCTDALEMSALLINIQPGDEVIMPSYTFVSTALAFIRQGAKVIFIDSRNDHPGMDEDKIKEVISTRTKAIVPVHYAGVACDMDKIMSIASDNNIFVIEDAAQAIESFYKTKPLGGIGHLGCFSFHETKNVQCGEGGLLAVNDEQFTRRSEIIWEKGTNRAEFFRGEIDKYGWVDIGSSFLPSELNAAFLYAQLENLKEIQLRRIKIWNRYNDNLKELADSGKFRVPFIPEYATNNAHMYYLVCNTPEDRTRLIRGLKEKNIHPVFHYLSLHKSKFYENLHDGRKLKNSDIYTEQLVRLPFYYELSFDDIDRICENITDIFT